jgi:hypothetical protein
MRSYLLRSAAAALAFGVGTLLAAAPQFLSLRPLAVLGNSVLPFFACVLGAFWCLVLAFASGGSRGDLPFVLVMLGCAAIFLSAALATLAGVLFI